MSLYSNAHNPKLDAQAFLQSLPLFASLGQEQIAEVANRMQRRSFAPGVIIFHQDMPGIMLYMIEEGWIRIYSIGRTGQELTITIIGPKDIFGELSTLDNKNHSATAMTLSASVVWLLHKSDLQDLLGRDAGISRAMISILVHRVRSVIHHAEAMTFQDVQGRLAYVISTLAEGYGTRAEDTIEIDVPLTQADLATMVGATRESVNKALMHLRAQALIKFDGNHYTVVSSSGLRRLVYERGR